MCVCRADLLSRCACLACRLCSAITEKTHFSCLGLLLSPPRGPVLLKNTMNAGELSQWFQRGEEPKCGSGVGCGEGWGVHPAAGLLV